MAYQSRIPLDKICLPDEIMDILANIPFAFLFHEPRIIELSPSFITLRDSKPDDVNYLSDLFTVDFFKRKPIKNVRDYVYTNLERIISAYHYYNDHPMIPETASFDEPIGPIMERFISEYVDRMDVRNHILIEAERTKREKRLDLFTTAYDDREYNIFSKDIMADKFGMTKERIRQLLKGKDNTVGLTLCRSIINGSVETDDFVINPVLQSKFFDISYDILSAYSLTGFDTAFGITGEKTRNFFLNLIDYCVCDSTTYFEPLVIKDDKITQLNRSLGPMIKHFIDSALYLSIKDDVEPFLIDKFKGDHEIVDMMVDIIKSSNRFETITDIDGQPLYGLKWQYLQTIPSRVVRILYEHSSPMHYKEIFDEYNKRCSACGVEGSTDSERFVFRNHPLLEACGRSGVWKLRDKSSSKKNKRRSPKEEISSFLVSNGGKATVEQVKIHLDSVGLTYPENTIRTYLCSVAKCIIGTGNEFVHKDYIDNFPDARFSADNKNTVSVVMPIVVNCLASHGNISKMRDLIENYQATTGQSIRDTSLRMMLMSYPDLISIEHVGARGLNIKLLLSPEEAKTLTPSYFDHSIPEYHLAIIESALSAIDTSEYKCLSMSELYKRLRPLVPEGKRTNNIYKILKASKDLETYEVDGKTFVKRKE